MKRVVIGTPCYTGQVDIWYAHSLIETIKLGLARDIEFYPLWISFDSLVQRARNDTVSAAVKQDVDALIFVDSDIEWDPEWIFKLLDYEEDIVGGTYPKKGLIEEYVVRKLETPTVIKPNGLMEVSGLGTGFVKLSRNALKYLWDNSEPYIDPKDNQERRMICNVEIINGSLYSEDINMFRKLREGGFKIYLDTELTCNHSGPHKFTGNFKRWYKNITPKRQL